MNFLHKHTAEHSVEDLQKGLLNSLLVMAWVVEARDPYTGGHLWRVSQMSRILAKAAALPDDEVEKIAVGAFLHDLGKIGVPDAILTKPDRLTAEEFEIMRTHPEAGWRLLEGHPLAHLAEAAVRAHHEMPNGKGYPLGLTATAIPLAAKIVGICDAFDAMTSTRPYRAGMAVAKALSIIAEQSGAQFDAELSEIFVELGNQGAFAHIVSHSDHGIPLQHCAGCGPIVVIQRQQAIGEHVFCHSCHAEFVIAQDTNGQRLATSTGRTAAAHELVCQPDQHVIQELVEQVV